MISDLLACLLMTLLHDSLCLLLIPISLLIIPALLITLIMLTNPLPYCLTHPPPCLLFSDSLLTKTDDLSLTKALMASPYINPCKSTIGH
jgi:hypothetical protein